MTREEIFNRIELLKAKQTQLEKEFMEPALDLSQPITYGDIDMAMKIRAKQFDRLAVIGKELKEIVNDAQLLIAQRDKDYKQ